MIHVNKKIHHFGGGNIEEIIIERIHGDDEP